MKFHTLALEEEKKRGLAEVALQKDEEICYALRRSLRTMELRLEGVVREREQWCMHIEAQHHARQAQDALYKKQGEKLAEVSQQLRELIERGFTKAKEKEFMALERSLAETQTALEATHKKLSTSAYRINELTETIRDQQAQLKAYFTK